MSIAHLFTSAKADGADATIVQPTDWNDDHVITTYPFFPTILLPNNSNFTQRLVPFLASHELGTTSTIDPLNESTCLGPLILPRTAQLQKASVEVTGAYGAVNFRLALFAHDETNDRPGALIADSGDISANSATVKTWDLTSSEETLTGGILYWIGLHWPNTDTAGTFRLLDPSAQSMISLGKIATDTTLPATCIRAITQSTAAPADPFPSSHNIANGTLLPLMWLEFID